MIGIEGAAGEYAAQRLRVCPGRIAPVRSDAPLICRTATSCPIALGRCFLGPVNDLPVGADDRVWRAPCLPMTW